LVFADEIFTEEKPEGLGSKSFMKTSNARGNFILMLRYCITFVLTRTSCVLLASYFLLAVCFAVYRRLCALCGLPTGPFLRRWI